MYGPSPTETEENVLQATRDPTQERNDGDPQDNDKGKSSE